MAGRSNTTIILSVLAVIFGLRVLVQFVQSIWNLPVIPSFDSWQSGALSYSSLLTSQLVILALMAACVAAIANGRLFPRVGIVLCLLGVLYFAVMLVRGTIGFLELSANPWFNEPLPTGFHLVIAAFVTISGWYWSAPLAGERPWHQLPAKLMPWLAYPVTILVSLCLFNWLVRTGEDMAISANITVILAVTAIIAHELLLPYRAAWLPDRQTVGWDGFYLVLIQIALPALLTLLLVGALTNGLAWLALNPSGIWPHEWPIAVQVLIMLLVADFLRYWLHRYSHKIRWLWTLHAVHHSPKELYTLNVARFHPADKALQFLFDALPFALLGVSSQVLSTYFVFYAVNGFFQHSNASLRLGFLNWIVAGPELHRWHHAKNIDDANHNYGNNLIIWDALFGTRYLPENREVGELGIGNTDYPKDFLRQTIAPVVTDPDAGRQA